MPHSFSALINTVFCKYCSELVTRQEERKQDSELGLGAHKKIRGQPVKN
jgi:hypothetical protein